MSLIRRTLCVIAVAAAALATACGSDPQRTDDGRSDAKATPTILLEAGDESDISQWRQVIPGLISQTRTCAYDRLGNGRSDDATGCRGLGDLPGDLEALLKVAKVDGPYVLVGTSGGGYLMAGLAARRPADVAGLVLVETPRAAATTCRRTNRTS